MNDAASLDCKVLNQCVVQCKQTSLVDETEVAQCIADGFFEFFDGVCSSHWEDYVQGGCGLDSDGYFVSLGRCGLLAIVG